MRARVVLYGLRPCFCIAGQALSAFSKQECRDDTRNVPFRYGRLPESRPQRQAQGRFREAVCVCALLATKSVMHKGAAQKWELLLGNCESPIQSDAFIQSAQRRNEGRFGIVSYFVRIAQSLFIK